MISQSLKPNILQNGVVNILTDANFDQAISSVNLPVLVDFWAEWCIPCKMMAPIIDTLAREYSGRAYFAKINTDQNRRTQSRFGITGIPNFIVIKNGQQAGQAIGSVGRQGIENLIRPHLIT
ncbi:thioredoxin [Candidatus Bathyarchaeota archaeon]|nr:thioredoxin [Candidatus Bathyarchaeota archaeon]